MTTRYIIPWSVFIDLLSKAKLPKAADVRFAVRAASGAPITVVPFQTPTTSVVTIVVATEYDVLENDVVVTSPQAPSVYSAVVPTGPNAGSVATTPLRTFEDLVDEALEQDRALLQARRNMDDVASNVSQRVADELREVPSTDSNGASLLETAEAEGLEPTDVKEGKV